MEGLWKRAKSFAEEAAKKSQSISLQSSSASFVNLVSETAKKSKELAIEASKKADEQLNVSELVEKSKEFAMKQADQIQNMKSIADIIPPFGSGSVVSGSELASFGITDDLREFVKGLTSATFQAFPQQDESSRLSDFPNTHSSNVRKDLSDWQERHATLVLGSVKQISKLRYELCPRVMKERRFWRIYFTLVSTHVSPYERKYMEELRNKAESKDAEANKTPTAETDEKNMPKTRLSTASSEQDLDTFLLGDLEDSDEAPDDGDGNGSLDDDDLDKIGNSDVEEEKEKKKETNAAI